MQARSYGFKADDKPVPKEIRILSSTLTKFVKGKSIHSILNDLEKRGVTTLTGKSWQRPSLRRRWLDPRLREHMDPDVWDAAVAKLNDPARRTVTTSGRRYLATGGKARCARCGHPLQAQPNVPGERGYACRKRPGSDACGGVRISAKYLEDDMAAWLLYQLAAPKNRKKLAPSPKELAAIPDRIDSARKRLKELAESYADGDVDKEFMLQSRARIQSRIDTWERMLARGEKIAALLEVTPQKLAAWWETSSLDDRREVLDLVLDHVLVHPQTRPGYAKPDSDRLEYVPL